jgi:hypothetical protein
MKVGIFYSSINNIHKAPHKAELMDSFADGVRANGDEAIACRTPGPIPTVDAGFILGYTLENNYRKRIIDTLKLQKAKIIFVDSNIFSYGRSVHFYHRYSVNSVYPVDGEYFLGEPFDKTKWPIIAPFHKLTLKPWRTAGNHILILAQKTYSWNMLGTNGLLWVLDIIKRIKKVSDRPIVVRLHPGDKKHNAHNEAEIYRMYGSKRIQVSKNSNIKDDLQNAWCSVGYNSTPNCASVIEGVPVYLDDPLNSWAQDVGFNDLSLIANPPMPDRTEWLDKISTIHWSNDEIRSGKYWQQFKNFYKL